MSKRPETVSVQEFRRRAHEEELRRLEAESDDAIASYQRLLAKMHASGTSRVICVDGGDGKPWYVEPHDAGDDDGPAPVQFLGHGEPAKTVETAFALPLNSVARPIVRPPGSRLIGQLDCLPGRARLRKDIEQVIADMRDEHFQALAAGDLHGARLALVRGHVQAARAIVPSWVMGLLAAVARWFVGRLG
jgi:hypothetical protein